LAAVVEQSHDDKGIIWPLSVAPYQVYFCPLHVDNPELASTAEDMYQKLEEKRIEVLFDDRDESPGVKFNDADLLGIPLRLTLSPRTLKNHSMEMKWRRERQVQILPLSGLAADIHSLFAQSARETQGS
jgi:prolyl-tRNA synthetase